MSRRRRQIDEPGSAAAPGDGRLSADVDPVSRPPTGLLTFVVSVLVAARYFLPTESTALGETLWIVQIWLIAGVCWLWLAARNGQRLRRLDSLDLGLGLLVGGHVLSAILVLLTEGDRRAALNMLWEWVGIGLSALMIREVVSNHARRGRLVSVIVISAITLAGLGLWQHYVWYPQVSSLLTEFDQLTQAPVADPADAAAGQRRLQELRRELGALTVTDDSAAAELMRARILASTEPIGRFALANSFAGLLLVGLFLGFGGLLSRREGGSAATIRHSWIGFVLVVAPAYCFWLTKSRTAWVGLVAGLLAWGVMAWRGRVGGTGLRRVMGLLVALLVALPIVASLSGGLDREVITEAPKSMQYRLEYWTATGGVIRDHPLAGVGPGNFRQAYLKHKLPGSSEEVLDPHNLFLDVWANGGMLALAGLLTILYVGARELLRVAQREHEPREQTNLDPAMSTFAWRSLVGTLALGLAAFTELLNGTGFSDQGWWLLIGWYGVSLLWPRIGGDGRAGPLFGAAAIALIVHLMGAGGIAMPALLQTLVILVACVMGDPSVPMRPGTNRSPSEEPVPWRAMGGAALCLCLAVACAFTATLPVSAARTQTQVGRALLAEGNNIGQAMRSFQAAIEADPLAAEPWQELAVALMIDWGRLAGTDDGAFTDAVAAQQEAIRRNPRSARGWQMLGRIWWRRYDLKQEPFAAEEAFAALQQAVEHYPNLATLQAELAQAAAAVGDSPAARAAAAFALELDDLNREQGHIDKLLPETARKIAETIAGA